MSDRKAERVKRSVGLYAPEFDYSKESRALRWVDRKIKDKTLAAKDFNGEMRRFFVANYLPESLEESGASGDEVCLAYKEAIGLYKEKIRVLEWKLSTYSDSDDGEVGNSDSRRRDMGKNEVEVRRLNRTGSKDKEKVSPFDRNREVFG